PRRVPDLWQKLRVSRKKPFELLPSASFRELVRSFGAARKGFGVQGAAVAALREGCEAHLLLLLEEWGLCALHAKRSIIQTADVRLVRCLQKKTG
ncbi:H3 protein, partial [Glaucidium brasilianum]|nr:H3 protein [Glaucidium brasilianum]